MSDRVISKAVIQRLPRYHRYLGDLLAANVERISSTELADLMKVTASQVRQDFNTFGGFGQQGYGYNVRHLREEMGKILGLDRKHTMVMIGAGNLAKAFANYNGFELIGFSMIGIFDTDPEKIGKNIKGISVMNVSELSDFAQKNSIDVAILAVPKSAANVAAKTIIDAGIKNIWNFVPTDIDIDMPKDIIIQNEHLADGLIQLSYTITAAEEEKK